MAIEKTIIIKADDKDARKAVKDLNQGLTGLNKSGKKASGGVGFVSKAFKGLGTAMKAAGIGLVISALVSLKDIFSKNQKVVDVFSTAFETFSIVANQVFTAVINVYESVAKSSENFDALGEVLGSIIKIALTPFKLAFYGIKLAIQTAQLGWEESFFGDKDPETIKQLRANIKQTGEDIREVGLDAINAGKNIVENIGEAVNEVVNIGKVAGNEFGKISISNAKIQAKANVELKKQAELAAVINQGLIEKFDRQAEQLRQVRDDESKNIEERIKANEELAEVLDEQEKAMKKNAAIAVAAAAAELSKNEDNIELQKAYQEALNEQAAIEAQITGFRSEQQTNVNSLLREQKDLQNELALIGKSERDIEREELKQQYLEQKELIDRQVTDETQKNELLLIAEKDFKTKLKELNDGFAAEDLANKNANDEAKKKIDDETKAAQLANAEQVGSAIGTLAGIAGEGTAAGKALGVASATIDTYVGANKAIAQGGFAGIAQAIAIIATGLTNVKTILSTKVPKTNVGGISTGGGGGGGGAQVQAPSFNIVGATDTNQLADAISGQTQQPVQAFVVANDVTSAQSMERNIVEGASLG